MKLKDKVIIITGAGSGIGAATAHLMAAEGANVIIADRALEAAGQVAADILKTGGRAEALAVDVSHAKQVEQAWADVVARHGRLDVLVNNAGYGLAGTVVDTGLEDWDALMQVNVNGIFYGCRYAIPFMAEQGGGVIVNTASVAGQVGLRQRAAYCASKGAVIALTRAMALDHVAQGIRVNCVAPGTIESPYFKTIFAQAENPAAMRAALEQRQPMGRLGQPEEVARAIVFLACEDSAFATGSVLVLDGGLSAA